MKVSCQLQAANRQSALAINRMRDLFRQYADSNYYQRNLLLTAKMRHSKIHENSTTSNQAIIQSE